MTDSENQVPDGKLNSDDNSSIHLRIGIYKGRIIVYFGTNLSWMGMSKEEALGIANSLVELANQL